MACGGCDGNSSETWEERDHKMSGKLAQQIDVKLLLQVCLAAFCAVKMTSQYKINTGVLIVYC